MRSFVKDGSWPLVCGSACLCARSGSLVDVLHTLETSCALAKDRGGRALNRELQQLAAGAIGGHAEASASLGRDRMHDLARDATQRILLRLYERSVRFRGQSEAEARSWLYKVLRSGIGEELRKRRSLSLSPEPSESEEAEANPAHRHELGEAMAVVARFIRETRRADARRSLSAAVECYLDWLAGATIEEQVREWGFPNEKAWSAASQVEKLRARNRIYQYHRRAAEVMKAALAGGVPENDAMAASVWQAAEP